MGVGSATGRGISQISAGGGVVFGPPGGGGGNKSRFSEGGKGGGIKDRNGKFVFMAGERRQNLGNFEHK